MGLLSLFFICLGVDLSSSVRSSVSRVNDEVLLFFCLLIVMLSLSHSRSCKLHESDIISRYRTLGFNFVQKHKMGAMTILFFILSQWDIY